MMFKMKRTTYPAVAVLTIIACMGAINTAQAAVVDQKGTTQAVANFSPGSLLLNNVPDTFDFGTLPISTNTVIQPLSTSKQYNLAITDTRGQEAGYKVSVSAPVMQTSDGKLTMNGNNIHLTNPTVTPVGNHSHTQPPVVNQNFFADAVDQQGLPVPTVISTAHNNTREGQLAWNISWNGANVNLVVQPGEAEAKQYSTNITWTLSDVPA